MIKKLSDIGVKLLEAGSFEKHPYNFLPFTSMASQLGILAITVRILITAEK